MAEVAQAGEPLLPQVEHDTVQSPFTPPTFQNSYDEVPYKSYPYRQTHPERLATMATLFGMTPAPLDACRVLELGCCSGGNLIPLAEQLPGSHFVGIDLSSRQIADGQAQVHALGLKNIRLEHKDILDVGPELGTFDYIITHGVYSWIPNQVQDKLLDVCVRNLAPNGVAYVSYNTYPGWRMRGMIRDMMSYRARSFEKPADRVRQARALLDFLAKSVPAEDNAYGILLKNELNLLREKEDHYLLHEHLEENNEPVYFYQFVERAERKALQYLGEADFRVMSLSNFPREVEAMVHSVASDLIEIEQYMDFVRNRMFRQTLLCHRGIALDRTLLADKVVGLHVASNARPEKPEIDLRSTEPVTFRGPSSVLTTSEPLVKAAMLHLAEVWPQSVSFATLLATARSQLDKEPVVIDAGGVHQDARKLAGPLLRCYSTALVELSAQPSPCTVEPARRPVARRLARVQAQSSGAVTNLRHEIVQLTDLERQVLRRLDGQQDQSAILNALVELAHAGALVVRDNGKPVENDRIKQILGRMLDQTVSRLARQALLVR